MDLMQHNGNTNLSNPLKILIVDDHPLICEGLQVSLSEIKNFRILDKAYNVEEAIEKIHNLEPDVVVLDVHLPGGNGTGAVQVVNECADVMGKTKFLALSVSDAPSDVISVIKAGARGYVTKTISREELVEAIVRVASGDAAFSPKLAGFVLDAFSVNNSDQCVNVEDKKNENLYALTKREYEVMKYIARGYTYKEIAAELYISIRTVESHVSAVLRKLQLSNRNELMYWAMKRNIL